MQPTLVFVYNADSGLFNLATDIAHKILSPSTYNCNLCQLAYGVFSVKKEWVAFLEHAPFEAEFLHRDEFQQQYPEIDATWPAVFMVRESGLTQVLDAAAISACGSLDELKALILEAANS